MHIVLGASGTVGSAVAHALLERGELVTVVVHDEGKAGDWQDTGARVAVLDVRELGALRTLFRSGQRLLLLNPPGAARGDTDADEQATLATIFAALEGSGLERVVAESTYGAGTDTQIGDRAALHRMERTLARSATPSVVLRAAYSFSNWDGALELARDGVVPSLFSLDSSLPMVAPRDLGALAATLLVEPEPQACIHAEGPARYTARDVAAAFARALGRDVRAVHVPRGEWRATLRRRGFSERSAASFEGMTEATLESNELAPPAPRRGPTTLEAYIESLVRRARR